MRTLLSLVVTFTLLFQSAYALDTVKVGVQYSSDTLNSYYHPRFLALDWNDTIIFHNQSGFHTTTGYNNIGFFPTFSTTPGNPYFQFQLNQAGIYNYFDQNQGQQINGKVFQNPQGLSCDVNFSFSLDSSDNTNATYIFTLNSQSGSIAQAYWDYHDGSIDSSGVVNSHTFSQSGLFHVSVTVRLSNGCYATYTEGIQVNILDPDGCKANFTSLQQGLTDVYFYSGSTTNGNSLEHSWYINQFGFKFSDQKHSSYTFPDTGWYEVCLIVEDSLIQCVDTICKQVYVNPPAPCTAQTNYVVNPLNPLSYSISAIHQNGHNAIPQWYINDKLISNQWTFNHSFFEQGAYVLKLILADSAFCYYEQVDTLHVQSSTGSCSSSFIYALDTNRSTLSVNGAAGGNPPFQFTWDFGQNASPRTAQGIAVDSIAFNKPGIQIVTMVTIDGDSCVTAVKDSIFIPEVKNCNADFNFLLNGFRLDLAANVISGSTALNFEWQIGDSTFYSNRSLTHIFQDTGWVQVCLTVWDSLNFCNVSACDSLYIQAPYCFEDFNYQVIGNKSVQFQLSNTPLTSSSILWDFGDGSSSTVANPIHQYAGYGSYVVSLSVYDSLSACSSRYVDTILVVNSNCSNSITLIPFQNNPYKFMLQANDFNAVAPLVNYWNIPGASPDSASGGTLTELTFPKSGNYQVCLTSIDSTGCVAQTCDSIFVAGSSVLTSFNYQKKAANFFDFREGVIASHSISSYYWDFGDGNTSAKANPIHVYDTAGNFQVCLTAVDTFGASHSFCDTVFVDSVVNFFCSPDLTATVDSQGFVQVYIKTAGLSPIAQYSVNLSGYATYYNQDTVTYNLASAGNYTVTLSVLDTISACTTAISKNVSYNGTGVCFGGFTSTKAAGPYQYEFHPFVSGIGPSQVDSLIFDFGDGKGSVTSQSFSGFTYSFDSPGNYLSCLTIIGQNGCFYTFCDSVNVAPDTCATDFSYLANPFNLKEHQFQELTLGVKPMNFKWYFGDGDSSNLANPVHIFDTTGNFVVELLSWDATGCFSKKTDTIVVKSGALPCEASFTSFQQSNSTFKFNSLSVGAGQLSFNWSFGDGSNSSASNPTHTYIKPGNYLVCLEITDQAGCSSKACDWVTVVGGSCKANFAAIPDSSTGMLDYSFRPYFAGDSNATYKWIIDGHDSLTGMFVDYSFNSIGWHQVCLTVTDTFFGVPCKDTLCRDVYADTLFFNYVPEFETHAAGFKTIIFDNNTVSLNWLKVNNSSLQYTWDFGDGYASNLQNPIHIYADTGLFQVCLKVENLNTGKYRVFCDEVWVREGLAVEENEVPQLKVFPNPSSGPINLEWHQFRDEELRLNIVNVLGSSVYEERFYSLTGINKHELDVEGLPNGLYQVIITGELTTRKLVARLLKQ